MQQGLKVILVEFSYTNPNDNTGYYVIKVISRSYFYY